MPVSRCRKAKSAPTEKCLPSAANRIARASRSADSAAKASRISPSISGDDALPISARATTTAAMPPSWRSIRICAKSVTAPFLLLLLLAPDHRGRARSEEHTSELQSLMRISYAVFCLKKKNQYRTQKHITHSSLHNHTHILRTH